MGSLLRKACDVRVDELVISEVKYVILTKRSFEEIGDS